MFVYAFAPYKAPCQVDIPGRKLALPAQGPEIELLAA